ncbi:SprT-like domain-containing protein [Algoriphagus algorifonticola]|uniref:SprT-like domain-containing protein n=1 Tax=Algoriphagus algorifonticola TaxID=2593007 RepID=UPI0011A08357|nr:SprT-like domain-containing protein [Algoriphagus algorifonticola]
MNSSEKLRLILSKHIPANSLPYCLRLWEEKPFNFTVSKSRKSKLGDFRYRRDRSIQTITINGDLNPYQFLLTFIHEVAHLHTFLNFGIEIAPHGQEWKHAFQKLLSPLLTVQVFPRDLLIPLQRHMRAPKASSAQDLFLMKEMSKYDLQKDLETNSFLSDLQLGITFELEGRVFKKGETRRTRVLCEEIKTGKKYLITRLAKVKVIG